MPANAPTRRALIIEDDPVAARLCQHLLLQEGWQGTICSTGDAAVDAVADEPTAFSLIVLDLSLPQRNGVDVVREFRSLDGVPEVPLLVISAQYEYSSPHMEAARDLGAIAYLRKPFGASELRQALTLLDY